MIDNLENLGNYDIEIDFNDMLIKDDIKIYYKENDVNSAKVSIKLTSNGEILDLNDCDIFIKIQSSNNVIEDVITDFDSWNNIIKYTFPTNALNQGINNFEIIIVQDDWVKHSPKVYYRVLASIDDSNIEADNNFPVLITLIKDTRELHMKTEELIKNVSSLDKKLTDNENIRENNEKQRINEENIRIEHENVRVVEFDEIKKTSKETVDNMNTSIESNTKKIDDKIIDIQNQLDIKTHDKFLEVDTTLENKTSTQFNELQLQVNTNLESNTQRINEKIIEVDNKKNEMVGQVNNKVSEANDKIVNVESRMQTIEDTFDNLVSGKGYASEVYVDNKVASLVDSAPETLNTLNELANALGNDSNFATTVANQIGAKADKESTYTKQEVDIAISNIQIDTTPLQNQINKNKADILGLQSEFNTSENTKYTTINGIKEFECKSGYVDNIKIEGETLVNLLINYSYQASGDGSTFVSYFSENNGRYYNRVSGGKFTFINCCNKDLVFEVADIGGYENYEQIILLPNETKVVDIPNNRRVYGYFGSKSHFETLEGFKNTGKAIILNGEYSNKKIQHFEGLKSVGQGDKIEVLTHNENSFIMFDKLEGYYEYQSGSFIPQVGTKSALAICLPNTKYSTNGISSNITFWTSDNKFISGIGEYNNSFTTPINCRYVRGACYNSVNECYVTKGDSVLKVLPKHDKKQILTTLRSTPNGVKDDIFKQGDKYYKLKKCDEVVLNGNENGWASWGQESSNVIKFYLPSFNGINPSANNDTIANIYSDRFSASSVTNLFFASCDTEGISIGVGAGQELHVVINKTELETQDVAGFKKWLQANPVTIVYELKTPTITEMPNFNPRTFANKTTLLINSVVVQGEASFEVTNSLRSEIDVLKHNISELNDVNINNNIIDLELAMLNGWDFLDKTHMFAFNRYGNIVTLSVVVKPGVLSAGTQIAKLPKLATPSKEVAIPMIGYDRNPYVIFIGKNGTISIQSSGAVVSTSWYAIQTTYFVN